MELNPITYEDLIYIPIGKRQDLIERVVFTPDSTPDQPELQHGELFENDTIYRFSHGRLNSIMFQGEDDSDFHLLPAIETDDGHMEYYSYGILHREDGPAVIAAFGEIEQYWRYGTFIREVFNRVAE